TPMVSHTDLNRARLPIPPRPHIHFLFAFFAERKIYYTTLIFKKQALFSFFYKYFDIFSSQPVRLLSHGCRPGVVQKNVNLYGDFFIFRLTFSASWHGYSVIYRKKSNLICQYKPTGCFFPFLLCVYHFMGQPDSPAAAEWVAFPDLPDPNRTDASTGYAILTKSQSSSAQAGCKRCGEAGHTERKTAG
ncbi:MAG: hypothetical protein ACI4SU_08970, partial [Anaerovoracaceae bacterium]